jgi:hypothetical protein
MIAPNIPGLQFLIVETPLRGVSTESELNAFIYFEEQFITHTLPSVAIYQTVPVESDYLLFPE